MKSAKFRLLHFIPLSLVRVVCLDSLPSTLLLSFLPVHSLEVLQSLRLDIKVLAFEAISGGGE
jgi:hypothetical protein